MKKLLIVALVLGISNTSCLKSLICIDGNGDMETEIRVIKNFTSAVNMTEIDVVYKKADSVSLILKAESNLLNNIVTESVNGKLEIRTDPRNSCLDFHENPLITITSPELNEVLLTGSGSFTLDTASGSSVEIKLTGSGDIVANSISVDDLDVTITGSGDADILEASCLRYDFLITGSGNLRINGAASSGQMKITGSGDIISRDFLILQSTAVISGSGDIFTYVQNSLTAVISGSGNIYLKGNPSIDQTITGSGRIIKQ